MGLLRRGRVSRLYSALYVINTLYVCFFSLFFAFFNCSQTKFVAIIVLSIFYAIYRLTDFSSDAFNFLSSKTG